MCFRFCTLGRLKHRVAQISKDLSESHVNVLNSQERASCMPGCSDKLASEVVRNLGCPQMSNVVREVANHMRTLPKNSSIPEVVSTPKLPMKEWLSHISVHMHIYIHKKNMYIGLYCGCIWETSRGWFGTSGGLRNVADDRLSHQGSRPSHANAGDTAGNTSVGATQAAGRSCDTRKAMMSVFLWCILLGGL